MNYNRWPSQGPHKRRFFSEGKIYGPVRNVWPALNVGGRQPVFREISIGGERKRIMGIIKKDKIIAWQDGSRIICPACSNGDPEEKPLLENDFEDDDYVFCDECGAVIKD